MKTRLQRTRTATRSTLRPAARARRGALIAAILCTGAALSGCTVDAEGSGDDTNGGKDGDGGEKPPVSASAAPFFLPTGEADNTSAPRVEVGPDGTVHTLFPAYAGGRAYYASCGASCTGPEDMHLVRFDVSSSVHNAMLTLDAEGRPRVLLTTYDRVYFGSCDGGCGDVASWRLTELLNHQGDREVTGEAFALDPQGHPRFVMHTTVAYLGIGQKPPGTWYATTDGDPHDPASWSFAEISEQIWEASSLRFDAAGAPRLSTVAHVVSQDGSTLRTGAFVQCNGNCTDDKSWQGVGLESAFLGLYDAVVMNPSTSLVLTSEGAPRLVLIGQDDNLKRRVTYFECDADCGADASWEGAVLSNLDGIGPGVDIALGADGNPVVGYTLDYNIGLLRCLDGDCGSGQGWDVVKVELGGELEPDDIFLEYNCNVAAWFLHSPSVAVAPDGAVRVGYQARDISGGWENPDDDKPDCQAGTDMTWSRLALMATP